jgi:hypothetical protein
MHLFKLQENLFLKKILEFLLSKIGSISFINKYSFFLSDSIDEDSKFSGIFSFFFYIIFKN